MSLIKPTPVFGEKQPPPPEFKEQFLFLLEFYVYEIKGERPAKLNQMFFVPTCVGFHFLDFQDDDLEITPVNLMFAPQAGIADDIEYFYSGRSVMFSVSRQIVGQKSSEFKIKLCVRKKMPESIKPDVLIGEAEIDMTGQFAALRKEMFQCWNVGVPPPQIFEDDVPLIFDQEIIGSIKLFLRLSSFGQSITTEFQAPKGQKSFVFKGNKINDKSLSYKCRIIDSREIDICKSSDDETDKNSCRVCQPTRYPCSPCALNHAISKPENCSKSLQNCPEKSFKVSENCFKHENFKGSEKCFRQGNFKSSENCFKQGNATKLENCFKSEIARDFKVAKQEIKDCGSKIIGSSRGSNQPCGKAVVLKVSGLLDVGDGNEQPRVTVAPECETGTPNCDPDHDVFILRIGKKGLVGPNEKSDLQLEMKTPKGPERRPPIRHETREAQTEEDSSGTKKNKAAKKKKKKK